MKIISVTLTHEGEEAMKYVDDRKRRAHNGPCWPEKEAVAVYSLVVDYADGWRPAQRGETTLVVYPDGSGFFPSISKAVADAQRLLVQP